MAPTATAVGSSLYFSANSKIWRSDGRPEGTSMVVGTAGQLPSLPARAWTVRDRLIVLEVANPQRLWSIDNATGQAAVVHDFDAAGGPREERDSEVLDGVLYFAIYYNDKEELWRTDGTSSGTYRLLSFDGKFKQQGIDNMVSAGGRLFFTVERTDYSFDLMVSDGTPAGTNVYQNIRPNRGAGQAISWPGVRQFTPVGDRVFFTTWRGMPAQLLLTDGTAPGTTLVTEAEENFPELAVAGNRLFFISGANTYPPGPSLWVTDGTSAGTNKLHEISSDVPFPWVRGIYSLHVLGERAYFVSQAGTVETPMTSDGTVGGTSPKVPPFLEGLEYADYDWPQGLAGGGYVFRLFKEEDQFPNDLYFPDGVSPGQQLAERVNSVTLAGQRVYYWSDGSWWASTPTAGTIAGTVFDDANADGARDTGEKALPGYKVYIDRNNDGVCNKNEQWTRASSTGRYRFDLVPAGKYRVRIVGVEGRRGSTSDSFVARVTPDGTFTRYFGRTERVLVAGIVYMDANQNGTIDNGESGMTGWTAFVDSDRDGVQDGDELTAITDDLGRFVFSTLPAGSWQIRVVGQAKYKLTAPGSGYRSVTLGPGESSGKANFGQKRIA